MKTLIEFFNSLIDEDEYDGGDIPLANDRQAQEYRERKKKADRKEQKKPSDLDENWYSVKHAYGDFSVAGPHKSKRDAIHHLETDIGKNMTRRKNSRGSYELDGRHIVLRGEDELKRQGFIKEELIDEGIKRRRGRKRRSPLTPKELTDMRRADDFRAVLHGHMTGDEYYKKWPEMKKLHNIKEAEKPKKGINPDMKLRPLGKSKDGADIYATDFFKILDKLAVQGPSFPDKPPRKRVSEETLDESIPHLTAAIKHNGKIFKAQPEEYDKTEQDYNSHAVAIHQGRKVDPSIPHRFEPEHMGFVNHRGHYLNRDQAWDYAKRHDLIHPDWHDTIKRGFNGPLIKDMLYPKKYHNY